MYLGAGIKAAFFQLFVFIGSVDWMVVIGLECSDCAGDCGNPGVCETDGKCFIRQDVNSIIYRGCADENRWQGLDIAYTGCVDQDYLGWNNERAKWCLCETDKCNAAPLETLINDTVVRGTQENLNSSAQATSTMKTNSAETELDNTTVKDHEDKNEQDDMSITDRPITVKATTETFLGTEALQDVLITKVPLSLEDTPSSKVTEAPPSLTQIQVPNNVTLTNQSLTLTNQSLKDEDGKSGVTILPTQPITAPIDSSQNNMDGNSLLTGAEMQEKSSNNVLMSSKTLLSKGSETTSQTLFISRNGISDSTRYTIINEPLPTFKIIEAAPGQPKSKLVNMTGAGARSENRTTNTTNTDIIGPASTHSDEDLSGIQGVARADETAIGEILTSLISPVSVVTKSSKLQVGDIQGSQGEFSWDDVLEAISLPIRDSGEIHGRRTTADPSAVVLDHTEFEAPHTSEQVVEGITTATTFGLNLASLLPRTQAELQTSAHRPVGGMATTTPSIASIFLSFGECPDGFQRPPMLTSCYIFVRQRKSQRQADLHCSQVHPRAHLVNLESVEEYNWVTARLKRQPGLLNGWQGWWTSGIFDQAIREYVWSNTGYVISRLDTRWQHGLLLPPYQGTCVWLVPLAEMVFGNYGCHQTSGFICEIDHL